MTLFVRSTVVEAAEHAMRAHLGQSDQPLARLEALAKELFVAFCDAAGGRPEVTALAEVAAGFRCAYERIWIEFGGDPNSIPDVAFPLETYSPTPWSGPLPQQ